VACQAKVYLLMNATRMGLKVHKYFYKDGETSDTFDNSKILHREDGPASIGYYPDGSLECEKYFFEGKLHREGGPAIVQRYRDGSIASERYCIAGKYHREDGPAYVDYYTDGSIKGEVYHIEHKLHRLDGPTIIGREKNGYVGYKKYHIDGELISESEFLLRRRHEEEPYSQQELLAMSEGSVEEERKFANRILKGSA